jgi:A/G-specific adenine glycosylase
MNSNVSVLGTPAKRNAIVRRVLKWWDHSRRELAWRRATGEAPNPYRVWLSEVLLQQTTARAATPYYQAFVARWPTVEDLAAAPHEAVIARFAGLGYYSRARNMHECAKEIVRRGGRFPDEEADLLALPGIGPYTAAAIAAIAFGRRTLPVDGNIARVLSRLVALEGTISENRFDLLSLARSLAPANRPGDFAEAMMDIGATICRPRNPDCATCPLERECAGARSGAPGSYPRRGERKARSSREGAVFFARHSNGAFLARRRPSRGLLASTIELPGTCWTAAGPSGRWGAAAPVAASWRRLPGTVRQDFTDFSVTLTVYAGAFEGEAPERYFWVRPRAIPGLGFSSLMRKAIAHALEILCS